MLGTDAWLWPLFGIVDQSRFFVLAATKPQLVKAFKFYEWIRRKSQEPKVKESQSEHLVGTLAGQNKPL